MEQKFCQSCRMSMEGTQFGPHADGTPNEAKEQMLIFFPTVKSRRR